MKAFPGMDIRAQYEGSWDDKFLVPFTGMDLRDYFAAKALNASWVSSLDDLTRGEVKDIATACYILADAMMEARK
jgi:hypothetical protein